MGKISYSQFSQWDKCPQMWKLNYLEKLGTFQGNIYTIFGSALHETLQAYLVAYYEKTVAIADSLPLGDILQYRMEENYKRTKENSSEPVDVSLEEMKEFFNDGLNIINEFLKRKRGYFPKKDHELLGIELDIDFNLPREMRFVGFMDVVIHNKKTGRVRIIDIKTSTMGWNKYMKADKNKTNQLLLYKKFFSKQRDIPEDKIVTCEMKAGSVLFLHQLVPHRSLENFSDDVRWSVDLRFQNPKDEAGFHTGLVDPIIMRKSEDSSYIPNWEEWFKGYEDQHTRFRGTGKKDAFDSSVDGSWLDRWDK